MACALTGLLAGCTTAMQIEPRLPVPTFPTGAVETCQAGDADACRRLRVFEAQYQRFITVRERVLR